MGISWTPDQTKEVIMTRSVSRTSAIALGVAALVSLSTLSAAFADTSAAPTPSAQAPAPASSAAAPSLSEPAPTPGWAESGPRGTTVAQHPVRHYAHPHYAYRSGRRYYSDNPVATAATGVAGGVADLGSIAAYPFYCFPNYGSCSVRVPYRFWRNAESSRYDQKRDKRFPFQETSV
jgi:hypothetical protein